MGNLANSAYLCSMMKSIYGIDGRRLPAEWEEQEAIVITWPHEATDWRPMLESITETYVGLALTIALRERLIIVCPDKEAVIQRLLRGIGERSLDEGPFMGRISYVEAETNDTWTRDHGPITLLDRDGERVMLDFRFNGWGGKFSWDRDNHITRCLSQSGLLRAGYEDHDDFVLEGGSIESDGRGTLFTTPCCLMAPGRNQPMDQKEIEIQLKRRLSVERVVWIEAECLEGDDTDGHIDTLMRVAPGDTLLYVGCDDEQDSQHASLKRMEDGLQGLTTLEGSPYRLMRLPSPEPIIHEGERLPATYANFLVINGAVICPTYGQPSTDREALLTIGKAFPGREIIGLDARLIIRQHGSIHCCTMQIPKSHIER